MGKNRRQSHEPQARKKGSSMLHVCTTSLMRLPRTVRAVAAAAAATAAVVASVAAVAAVAAGERARLRLGATCARSRSRLRPGAGSAPRGARRAPRRVPGGQAGGGRSGRHVREEELAWSKERPLGRRASQTHVVRSGCHVRFAFDNPCRSLVRTLLSELLRSGIAQFCHGVAPLRRRDAQGGGLAHIEWDSTLSAPGPHGYRAAGGGGGTSLQRERRTAGVRADSLKPYAAAAGLGATHRPGRGRRRTVHRHKPERAGTRLQAQGLGSMGAPSARV